MRVKTTGLLDHSNSVTNSDKPTLLGARLILANDGDTLEIYDHVSGPEYGDIIVLLDKDVPSVMFDPNIFRCNEGLYAYLPEGGKYIVYYGV